jgi:trehalose 6-phosphate synthase
MNLVAMEYVAAQAEEDPGVLILSQFAGAVHQLPGAVVVNPYDVEGVADALERSLVMPVEERRERWAKMMANLKRHGLTKWRLNFVSELKQLAVAA